MGRERVLLVWVVAVLIIIMVGVGESKYMVYNTSQGIVADKLNVHLVAHSHDDVGWLKTVDQYYVGSNNSIQGACVQNVLDSLIPALLADKNRKFIYVEQAFFQRWWRDQSEAMQLVVKKLVNSGQLEFINGGMCMHDEGPTHYIDMIDQTTLGHLFIKVEFNVTPRVGWQIDPFGHSAVQAYLLGAEVGFDSFFYGRIDYQDRAKRKSEKSLEVIWRGSKSLGSSSQIFAGAFPENYEPPSGFYFEVNDASPVVQDDPELFDYNVQERVNDFVAAAVAQANITRTNHIMWTMGTDFKYQYAHTWFRQLDKLIHYVNMSVRGGSGKSSFFSFSSLLTVITRDIKNITRSRDGRVNALYSTPSIYTDAKYATNQSWPIKTDDFFPYADRENAYWTGYFTSRPALKRYIRVLSGYYLAARQLEFFKGRSKLTNTDSLGDALAIAQHHDAVTGTEKQHVANDYAKRLSIGYKESEQLVSSSLACFVEPELECRNPATKFQQCPLLNVSYCPASEVQLSQGKILIVVIYNSLGWKREEVIQIPVISEDVIVHNSEGKEIESQLLPLVDTYVSLRNYYVKAYSGQTPVQTPKYWLAFPVSVPPLGFSSYVISNAKRPGSGSTKSSVHTFQIIESSTVEVGHGNLKLSFSRDHGKLTNYINSQSLVEEIVKQSYVFYTGYNGTNDKAPQNAGAYIFRPNGTFLIKPEEEVSSTIMRGPITDEVHQRINPWIYQVTRLHKGKEHVEVEYIVGPIPINDGTGKDVVTQVITNVDSNKTFYTDSNGRDFIKRIRDYRADWDLKVNQPVAGNYYPLNLGIYIQDDKKEFSVLVDRPVGGSSIVDGQIELMLHRRLLLDDSRGVAEALNETVCVPNDCKGLIIQGKLYYRIDPRGEGAKWRRSFGQEIYSPLLFAFSEQEGDNWINSHRPTFSWIDSSYSLPDNVAIITLQELDGGKVLLRLAHLYEIGEDKDLSVLTNVELKKLFPRKKISKVTETSLTANQERIEMEKKRLVWKVEGPSSRNDAEVKRGRPVDPASLIVELVPMEIRTFIIQFVSNPLSSI